MESGLLVHIEDLIRAEAFAGLLEQANYLFDEGYFLAAGVLGRAVLEGHVRNYCTRAGCVPSKSRPTISDYNDELYRAKHFNKIEMQSVIVMATIGNDAAHNKPGLSTDDVKRLLRDVPDFIAKHPLP